MSTNTPNNLSSSCNKKRIHNDLQLIYPVLNKHHIDSATIDDDINILTAQNSISLLDEQECDKEIDTILNQCIPFA